MRQLQTPNISPKFNSKSIFFLLTCFCKRVLRKTVFDQLQPTLFQRLHQNYCLIPDIISHDLTVWKRTLSNPYLNKPSIISSPSFQNFVKSNTTYISFYDLIIALSRILIGRHFKFLSPMCLTCCNLPQECAPVKYKERQKAGYPIVT